MNRRADMEKARRETNIFCSFARQSSLPVDLASVENCDPPEPDICCKLMSGESLRFELVEVLDSSLVAGIPINFEISDALNIKLESTDVSLLGVPGVLVGVDFVDDATDTKKRAAVSAIVQEAAAIPKRFRGTWRVSDRRLRRLVKSIFVSSGDGEFESEFWVISGSSFSNPFQEQVRRKGKKAYKLDGIGLELLAYFDRQPLPPGDQWYKNLGAELSTSLDGSQFRQAWVYSVRDGAYWRYCLGQ